MKPNSNQPDPAREPSIALYLVATSLAHNISDLSPRARSVLQSAKLVIGEEWRDLLTLMREIGREPSPERTEFAVLNEHSTESDLKTLSDRIEALSHEGSYAALVSDCGTPGFCDPGADLVHDLRKKRLKVSSVLGPCSLAGLISLAGSRFQKFWFFGFPSRSAESRADDLARACQHSDPVVLMDTPYRLQKLMGELAAIAPNRTAVLALDLSSPFEEVWEGSLAELSKRVSELSHAQRKREFMLWLKAINSIDEQKQSRHFDREGKTGQTVRPTPTPQAKGTTPRAKRHERRRDR